MTTPAFIRTIVIAATLAGLPAVVMAADPVTASAPGRDADEPPLARGYFEDMFALAADCTVALSVMEENGATIASDPNDWVDLLNSLGKRLDRDPGIEYMFRQTEISALLEVEPEKTSRWITTTADECAMRLPSGRPAHAGADESGVSRASS